MLTSVFVHPAYLRQVFPRPLCPHFTRAPLAALAVIAFASVPLAAGAQTADEANPSATSTDRSDNGSTDMSSKTIPATLSPIVVTADRRAQRAGDARLLHALLQRFVEHPRGIHVALQQRVVRHLF